MDPALNMNKSDAALVADREICGGLWR